MAWLRLVAENQHTLRLGVKAHDLLHHPLAAGQLFQLLAVLVEEVQVVVAVLLALHHKLRCVPR